MQRRLHKEAVLVLIISLIMMWNTSTTTAQDDWTVLEPINSSNLNRLSKLRTVNTGGGGIWLIESYSDDSQLYAAILKGSGQLLKLSANSSGADIQFLAEYRIVTGIAVSPVSDELAVSTGYNTVIWNLASERQTRTIDPAHDYESVTFHPTNGTVVTGLFGEIAEWDRTVNVKTQVLEVPGAGPVTNIDFVPSGLEGAIGLTSGVILMDWQNNQPVYSVVTDRTNGKIMFNATGSMLGFASETGHEIGLWDMTAQQSIIIIENGTLDYGNDIGFSADGSVFAIAGPDGVEFYNGLTGQYLSSLTQFTEEVTALSFSNDGRFLITGQTDGQVDIWAVPPGAQQPPQYIWDIDWNYDGSLLATGDSHGRAEVREASTNQVIYTYEGDFLDVDNVEWSPHENLLAVGSYAIVIVNVSTGETVAQIPMDSGFDLEWSPDGKYLASASGDGSGHYFVNVWDVQTETLMRYDWYKATDISWSPDSQRIAISSNELSDSTDYGPFAILDMATGVITTPFADETVNSWIAWSPNGNRIATTGFSDGCWCDLTMWDVASGQHVWSIDVGKEVFGALWGIDSQWLATTSHDGILFWDAATGQPSSDQSTIGIFANKFALNPDGIRLAYVSYDNNQPSITFATLAAPQPTPTGSQEGEWVTAIDWSPDSNYLAIGYHNASVQILDASTQAVVATFETAYPVTTLNWNSQSTKVAFGTNFGFMGTIDTTGTLVAGFDGESDVAHVVWSPDGSQLASANQRHFGSVAERKIKIWDAATSELVKVLEGHHTDIIHSLDWSPDGSKIISGGADAVALIWDVAQGVPILTLEGHTMNVFDVAWSPDGSKVATGGGSEDGTVRIWDAVTGNNLQVFQTGGYRVVFDIEWNPDGSAIAGATDTGLHIWELATGAETIIPFSSTDTVVTALTWSPDGNTIAYGGQSAVVQTVQLDNTPTPTPADSRSPHDTPANTITSIDWSPDGLLLATANNNGAIQIRDAASGTIVHDLITAQPNPVLTVAWSPDGTAIAATVNENVYIWERDTWQVLHVLQGHLEPVWSVAWSPDGTKLASVTNTSSTNLNFFIWDTSTGQQIQAMEALSGFYKVAWSPDNSSLSATGGSGVALWDVSQTSIQGGLQSVGQVVDAKWSPDGSKIVVVGETNIVSIWDAASQQVIQELDGHQIGIPDLVFAVEWSPDGSMVASAATDGTVRVWDAATGQSLHVINVGSEVYSVTWSPDGNAIAYGGESAVVQTAQLGITPTPTPSDSRAPHDTPANTITSIDWNIDGTLLAISYDSGDLDVQDVNTSQVIYEDNYGNIAEISWSPTNNLLAIAMRVGFVEIVDIDTGTQLMQIDQGFTVNSLAWHPDGNQFAVVSATGAGSGADYWIRVWDVTTQQLVSESRQFLVTSTDWSPDGQNLVVGSHEARTVVVNAATGAAILELSDTGTRTVAWNPDSRVNRFATTGDMGEVRVWDGRDGQMLWEVKTGRYASQFDWNYAGTQLAGASGSLLYLWDGETGNEITQFTADPALIDTVSWSPDDSKIAYGTTDGQVIILYLPIANVGPDQTVFTTSGQAPVTLDRSGSTDPDGTIASYEWSENGNVIATGAAPQVTLSVGTHTLTLKVTDNDGLVTTDDVVITVESGTAPTATSVTPTACNFTVSAGDLAGLIAAINTANGASSPTNICLADSSTYLVMPSGRTYSSPPS